MHVRLPLAFAGPTIVEAKGDGRRRIACGAASLVSEGALVSVPIIPSFEVVDEQIEVVPDVHREELAVNAEPSQEQSQMDRGLTRRIADAE